VRICAACVGGHMGWNCVMLVSFAPGRLWWNPSRPRSWEMGTRYLLGWIVPGEFGTCFPLGWCCVAG